MVYIIINVVYIVCIVFYIHMYVYIYITIFIYKTHIRIFYIQTLFFNCSVKYYSSETCMGFSGQEYWNGLPFPSLGYLPNLGIKPAFLASPALAGVFFTTVPPGKSYKHKVIYH